MTDFKQAAIEELKGFQALRRSLAILPQRIALLEHQAEKAHEASVDPVPAQGGGSRGEEWLVDNIVQRDELAIQFERAKKLTELINQGLAELSQQERAVLDGFYINRAQGHVDRLCELLGYEQAQIYRIKNRALDKLTLSMFGAAVN